MPAPAFGFSAGDLIATISLIGQVAKALKETDGAADNFQALQQELKQLQCVLEQLQTLQPSLSDNEAYAHNHAVRGMALTIQEPLQRLLRKMEEYNPKLGAASTVAAWRKGKRKIQWSLTMQDEVGKVRSIVTMKIVSLTALMVTPFSGIVRGIQHACNEQTSIMGQTMKEVQDMKSFNDKEAVQLHGKLDSMTSMAAANFSQILRTCADLCNGVRQIETKARAADIRRRQDQSLILRGQQRFGTATKSIRKTIQTYAIKTLVLVEQLLNCFTAFSKDVMERLKILHTSNGEIYTLLGCVHQLLLRSPDYTASDSITFVDALNRRTILPHLHFRYWEVFKSLLICRFRKAPGEGKIVRHEYRIYNSRRPESAINESDWDKAVFPGTTLEMSMVMINVDDRNTTCPRRNCLGRGSSKGGPTGPSDTFSCTDCGLQFVLKKHSQQCLSKKPLSLPFITKPRVSNHALPSTGSTRARGGGSTEAAWMGYSNGNLETRSWLATSDFKRFCRPLSKIDFEDDEEGIRRSEAAEKRLLFLYATLKFVVTMRRSLEVIRLRNEEDGLSAFTKVEFLQHASSEQLLSVLKARRRISLTEAFGRVGEFSFSKIGVQFLLDGLNSPYTSDSERVQVLTELEPVALEIVSHEHGQKLILWFFTDSNTPEPCVGMLKAILALIASSLSNGSYAATAYVHVHVLQQIIRQKERARVWHEIIISHITQRLIEYASSPYASKLVVTILEEGHQSQITGVVKMLLREKIFTLGAGLYSSSVACILLQQHVTDELLRDFEKSLLSLRDVEYGYALVTYVAKLGHPSVREIVARSKKLHREAWAQVELKQWVRRTERAQPRDGG